VRFARASEEGDSVRTSPGMPALSQAARMLLSLPFDALREQYAQAARAGIVKRSLVASGHFERALGALEQLSYGPFARRV
jgi:hypothetical protein